LNTIASFVFVLFTVKLSESRQRVFEFTVTSRISSQNICDTSEHLCHQDVCFYFKM